MAPPQDTKRERASAQANQDILRRVERGEAPNASAFFDQLFREPRSGAARSAPYRGQAPGGGRPAGFARRNPNSPPPPRPFLAIFGR